jgi:hypothetical protein
VSGLSAETRRAAEAYASASHELARRAADAIRKLVHDFEAFKLMVRQEEGVPTLRALLDRRDTKVQRAAAAALLTLGEHDRLVKEIEKLTETLVARPDADRARDALKTAVRTLAELAKEGQQVSAEGDMVDAVVRSGAVEAIVPLLSLSQRVGEEYDVSFGDIEKEASYAISLMASKGTALGVSQIQAHCFISRLVTVRTDYGDCCPYIVQYTPNMGLTLFYNQRREPKPNRRRWRASRFGRASAAVPAPNNRVRGDERGTTSRGRGDQPCARKQRD